MPPRAIRIDSDDGSSTDDDHVQEEKTASHTPAQSTNSMVPPRHNDNASSSSSSEDDDDDDDDMVDVPLLQVRMPPAAAMPLCVLSLALLSFLSRSIMIARISVSPT